MIVLYLFILLVAPLAVFGVYIILKDPKLKEELIKGLTPRRRNRLKVRINAPHLSAEDRARLQFQIQKYIDRNYRLRR